LDLRDQKLLDKQLWGSGSRPPSPIALAFAAMVFSGIIIFIGSALFSRDYEKSQIILPDVTGSISPQKPLARDPDSRTEHSEKVN
jgi:hypothetical protein